MSEMIQVRKVYGGLKYELNAAHNNLAEHIIVSSAKTCKFTSNLPLLVTFWFIN